jgi:hypothetical protein
MIAATAALAVGGSLAVAATASAAQIPWGSSTDTGSTSVYGLLNKANTGLIQAQNLIVGANGLAQAGHGTAVDPNFTTEFTSASSLTSANVKEIGTDVATASNTSQLELATCVFDVYPTATGDTSESDALSACDAANSPYLAQAVTTFTGTIQPGVASASASWGQLDDLITQLFPYGGSLYSIDSDVTVSSNAIVTAVNKPTAYNITVSTSGAAASGYVLPSGFTMSFPADFSVNTALAGAELPPTDEANPPASSAIGTVTVKTPVASEFGGSNGQLTGSVFVINANNSITQPDLELSFGGGVYLLGTFPTTLSFPLTLTFGEANVGTSTEPVPFSSVAINFPAATSPVKALNCSSLGQVNGTGTDEVAGLAAEFGDSSDGYAASGNSPVSFGSTATVVTDICAPTGSVKFAVSKSGTPSASVTLKGNGGTPFTSATITLPSGVSAKGLKSKDLKVTGAKVKSVSGGSKVTVNFKSKTKSATITFVKGLTISSKLIKSIAKHKTKSLTIKFTVKYAPTGAPAATSTAGSVTVKHL